MPQQTKKRRQNTRKKRPLLNSIFGSPRCHPSRAGKGNCIPSEDLMRVNAINDRDALQKDPALSKYFRPEKPNSWITDPDMWLDNTNINSVIRQYAETYSWFKFMGVFPIDFSVKDPYDSSTLQCLVPALCGLDLDVEYARGIRAIGIVYNLDPHYKEGSHWVANFIDMRDKSQPAIYYFDSYGEPAPKYIRLFMEELWKRAKKKPLLAYNARRFQYGDSECGMYSIYFIIAMLQGISFRQFVRHPVPDKEMIRLRDILFYDY
jgi:hypothetical protein